jgi:hypothetical protein
MKLLNILHEFFYFLTIALVIFAIMELAWPGIVLAYINLNLVLIFWLVNGILLLFVNNNN